MSERQPAECMIAIVRGEVRCAAVVNGFRDYDQTLAEWAADPRVTELVRVPTEVARMYLFKRWPGREAAIAAAMIGSATRTAIVDPA